MNQFIEVKPSEAPTQTIPSDYPSDSDPAFSAYCWAMVTAQMGFITKQLNACAACGSRTGLADSQVGSFTATDGKPYGYVLCHKCFSGLAGGTTRKAVCSAIEGSWVGWQPPKHVPTVCTCMACELQLAVHQQQRDPAERAAFFRECAAMESMHMNPRDILRGIIAAWSDRIAQPISHAVDTTLALLARSLQQLLAGEVTHREATQCAANAYCELETWEREQG
jgi:hypothetical protein